MAGDWKTVREIPRYEIAPDGKVRIRDGFRNAGYVVQRLRRGKLGSEYVYLFQDGTRYKRSINSLIGRYWPEKEDA